MRKILVVVGLLVSVYVQAPKEIKTVADVFGRRDSIWKRRGPCDAQCHPDARRNHLFTQTPAERDAFFDSCNEREIEMMIRLAVERIGLLNTQIQQQQALDVLVTLEEYEKHDKEVENLAALRQVLSGKRTAKRVLERRIADLKIRILTAQLSASPFVERMRADRKKLIEQLDALKEGRCIAVVPGGGSPEIRS